MTNVIFAFSLTLLSALATVIGSFIGISTKRTNTKFLSMALGFSGGIMLYLSFVEILGEARESLEVGLGENGDLIAVIGFFSGMLLIALLDKILPHMEEGEHIDYKKDIHDMGEHDREHAMKCLYRMGIFSALTIGIHNFPEGISTFMSALKDPTMGISVAVAIGIHNVTVGMAIAIPIYFATGDKKKAVLYSLFTAICAPIGALLAYFFLNSYLNEVVFGVIFSAVAGIMVFISLDEILPTAEKYGEHHYVIYGVISGMIVMAISLLIL